MKTFILNIYYRIIWWFIKSTTYKELFKKGMWKVVDYNFRKHTLDKYFSRYFMNHSEISTVVQHSENSITEISDGVRLECKRNLDTETYNDTPVYVGYLNTKRKFEQAYGLFELIAKVPKRDGFYWPAFWFYGEQEPKGSQPFEIDQFEMMNKDHMFTPETHRMSSTIHWNDSDGKHHQKGRMLYIRQDLSADYHKYGFLWTKKRLTWYLDDIPIYTLKNKYFTDSMYVIIGVGAKEPYLVKADDICKFDLKKLIIHQF